MSKGQAAWGEVSPRRDPCDSGVRTAAVNASRCHSAVVLGKPTAIGRTGPQGLEGCSWSENLVKPWESGAPRMRDVHPQTPAQERSWPPRTRKTRAPLSHAQDRVR